MCIYIFCCLQDIWTTPLQIIKLFMDCITEWHHFCPWKRCATTDWQAVGIDAVKPLHGVRPNGVFPSEPIKYWASLTDGHLASTNPVSINLHIYGTTSGLPGRAFRDPSRDLFISGHTRHERARSLTDSNESRRDCPEYSDTPLCMRGVSELISINMKSDSSWNCLFIVV